MDINQSNLPSISGDDKKYYSDNLPLRIVVQNIPYIGGILDSLLSGKSDAIKEERLKNYLGLLARGMDKIKEDSINRDWIQSEEFYDILSRSIASSINSRSREKMELNTLILLKVISVENNSNYRPEEYLIALENLTPTEVKALLVLYETLNYEKRDDKNDLQYSSRVGWKKALQEQCGIDEADIAFIMKRLETTGFVSEITGSFLDYTGGQYTITTSLKRLMEYISTVEENNE